MLKFKLEKKVKLHLAAESDEDEGDMLTEINHSFQSSQMRSRLISSSCLPYLIPTHPTPAGVSSTSILVVV